MSNTLSVSSFRIASRIQGIFSERPKMEAFLDERLALRMHPDKVFIKTLASGVDFLGWVHFPDHRVLRASTRRRVFKRLQEADGSKAVLASYLGLLSHGNAHKLKVYILSLYPQVPPED